MVGLFLYYTEIFNMHKVRQPEMSIFSQVSLTRMLRDVRPGRYGDKFGRVLDVCRQYGIKYRKLENCIQFIAPKGRLQFFIEKLHFSRTPYSRTSL